MCCELRLQHDSRHFRCNASCTWLHVVVFHGFLILILSRLVVSVGVVTMVDFAVLHALFLFEEMEERDRTWFKCFTAIQRLCRLLLPPSEDLFDRSILLSHLDQMIQAVTELYPACLMDHPILVSECGLVSVANDDLEYFGLDFGVLYDFRHDQRYPNEGTFWAQVVEIIAEAHQQGLAFVPTVAVGPSIVDFIHSSFMAARPQFVIQKTLVMLADGSSSFRFVEI